MENSKSNVVLGIFGASGLGREFLETAKLLNTIHHYKKIIFIDDYSELVCIHDIPVFDFDSAVMQYGKQLHIALAVGEPITRRKIIERIMEKRLLFETLIHPGVLIPDTTSIGDGCYVGPFSFISCDVTIGNHTIIQPHATIGHDCHIGNNVIISSMDALSGHVTVGDNTYIGVGTDVIQGCSIGRDSIIGMSSSVSRDIPDGVIALGNPARAMKKNEQHKVFS